MQNISVIVCTHNPREDYLQRVLNGLKAQTLPLDQWELFIVDNGSKLPVSGRFDLSWHPQGQHVREDELGLTAARLCGIRESRAAIIVFADDDTVLAPDYLEQTLQIEVEWPFIGVWGGRCIPEYEQPLPAWVGGQVWRLAVVDVKEAVWSNIKEGFETKPVGAGICVRRQVAEKFVEHALSNAKNKDLGRKGTNLVGYEEMNFSFSAIDLGLGAGKTPRLSLTHLIPTERLTLDYFVRHAEGDAASSLMFRAIHNLPVQEPRPHSLVYSLRWFVHRLIHQVPQEQYEIQKAHQRGLEKGWRQVAEYNMTKAG